MRPRSSKDALLGVGLLAITAWKLPSYVSTLITTPWVETPLSVLLLVSSISFGLGLFGCLGLGLLTGHYRKHQAEIDHAFRLVALPMFVALLVGFSAIVVRVYDF